MYLLKIVILIIVRIVLCKKISIFERNLTILFINLGKIVFFVFSVYALVEGAEGTAQFIYFLEGNSRITFIDHFISFFLKTGLLEGFSEKPQVWYLKPPDFLNTWDMDRLTNFSNSEK